MAKIRVRKMEMAKIEVNPPPIVNYEPYEMLEQPEPTQSQAGPNDPFVVLKIEEGLWSTEDIICKVVDQLNRGEITQFIKELIRRYGRTLSGGRPWFLDDVMEVCNREHIEWERDRIIEALEDETS